MKTAYLSLSRPDPTGRYRVALQESLGATVETWHASTRVSPVFLKDMSSETRLTEPFFSGVQTMLLLGPLHPATVLDARPAGTEVWLTLGAFNVIVFSREDRTADLLAWARTLPARHECWRLDDGAVTEVATSSSPPASPEGWRRDLARLAEGSGRPGELDEALKEFVPLMASALARASVVLPAAVPDLESLADFVRETVRELADTPSDEEVFTLLAHLTTINAALSRFTSQAFSGTTPVSDTESHYWTHSLLGTGTANIALWRLCTFALQRLGAMRLPQRLDALEQRPAPPVPLERLSEGDAFWLRDDVGDVVLSPSELAVPLTAVITCFSGRDGFRSSLQTLSAPLAAIGACNSLRWSLLTLTHEISHIAVRGALGVLYPRLTDDGVAHACALLNAPPRTLLAAAQRHLLIGVASMYQEATGHGPQVTPPVMRSALAHWQREVEEVMVHVFDFLYFYAGNPHEYVRGIWLSWGVIPNISHQVPEYVLRTLCALSTLHLRRGLDVEQLAAEQMRAALESLQRDNLGGPYVAEALAYLRDNWDDVRQRVLNRRPLVHVVKRFLYSDHLAAHVRREGQSMAGAAFERDGYGLRVHDFVRYPIENPLRFVEEYTSATQPLVLNSMWMLMMLAFNVGSAPDATDA